MNINVLNESKKDEEEALLGSLFRQAFLALFLSFSFCRPSLHLMSAFTSLTIPEIENGMKTETAVRPPPISPPHPGFIDDVFDKLGRDDLD